VLGDGAFRWGEVLRAEHRPEGVEVSPLVRRLIEHCDGRRTIGELVAAVGEGRAPTLLRAIRILYVDGIIDEVKEPP
jgi:hypothetical protein